MNTLPVSFGWVTTPTQPATGPASGGASATAAAMLGANRAFIEALPPAFTTLWFEDHFQWGADPTLEALTTAAFFAALYPRLGIGTLVLGQRYRSPALTAKMAANLQLLSGGRFILGLGAGWKQDEHEAYGFGYPRAGVRIDQLDEAVRLIKTMFTDSPASFAGSYYAIRDAYCEPRPGTPIPIMIGGNGPRTLHVAAAHADMWNGSFLTTEALASKKELLAEQCRAVGRDPDDLVLSYFSVVDLGGAEEAAPRPDIHFLKGDPSRVTAELQAFIDLGVRHFMLRFADFPSTGGLRQFTDAILPALRLT
jgi:alkanesulfonate monooxygenase SsuD/methylene tetrahydromethanopterin reductase-like flavin-dependent oxidoreductase (luciferase family)